MVSLGTHIVCALMLVTTLCRQVHILTVVLAVFYSVLPDLDMLTVHRVHLHNIFALSTMSTTVLIMRRLSVIEKIVVAVQPWLHLLLDLLAGDVAIIWPISDARFRLCNIWPWIRLDLPYPLYVFVDKLTLILLLLFAICTVARLRTRAIS